MAHATERLIVPISADDKAAVERKAAKLGRNMTAEFVRRAVLAYDPDDASDQAELRGLLDGFSQLHPATIEQLDRTDRALDAALAHFANLPARK